jgi:hypothetical protein
MGNDLVRRHYVRDGSKRIDSLEPWQNLRHEEGAGYVLGLADRGPYSEPELPCRSVDPDFRHRAGIHPMLLQRFHPEKISYIDQGKFRP